MALTTRIGNWFQNKGTRYNLPELGLSERFGVSPQGSANTAAQQRALVDSGQAHWEWQADGRQVLVAGAAPRIIDTSADDEIDTSDVTQPYSYGGGGGGGGGVTQPEYVPNWVRMGGNNYDLNKDEDKQRFYSDKLGLLTSMRDEEIAKSKGKYNQQLSQLDQAIQDTQTQAQEYVRSYKKDVDQFGQNYELGNVKRQSYFAGLSPNAYQSSQGTSQEYAGKEYLKGIGEMARSAQQNVGADFLSNPNAFNKLAPSSIYGRNIAGNQQQKNNLANAFNDYLNSINRDVQDQADSTATGLQLGPNYDYASNPLASPTANKSDVSPYTPYTEFRNPGGGTTPVTPIGSQKVMTPNAFTSGTPLENFLGQNQLTNPQTDWLRKYLLGQTS